MNEWVALSPSIDRGTLPRRLFRECFRRLAAIAVVDDGALRAIEDLRASYLAKLARLRDNNERRTRVVVSILCDLRLQGWEFGVYKRRPSIRYPQTLHGTPLLEKQRVQAGHLLERDEQLRQPATRRFILDMERQRPWRGSWVSIFSLMRDGGELAAALASREAEDGGGPAPKVEKVISPYLQVVDRDSLCEYTGLRLMDIWRYFRHTWTTTYQSTPGRKMFVLVRDSAAPFHPVIGIAGLGSPIVQLRTRDKWIGWTAKEFLTTLGAKPSASWAKWVLSAHSELLKGVYYKDLIKDKLLTQRDVKAPGDLAIRRLRREVREARRLHTLHWKVGRHKAASQTPDLANWRAQAETYLFRSKRARALAELLEARVSLNRAGFKQPTVEGLKKALGDRRARAAIQSLLRSMKAARAGVDMLDITICGAIEPYRALLGGKLVSLLMASPEIVRAYERRYKSAVSLIASSVAGKPVKRQPHLVLLGTTSLYGVASSQYNRIRVSIASLGLPRPGEIRFEELGRTEGFGSYHFSATTMAEMEALLRRSQGGRRVNSIFGEGVSPKLRKVRGALDLAGMPSNVLLKHGSPRLVYGIPLASNFREVLLGVSKSPRNILPKHLGRNGTALLANYWHDRWLTGRAQKPEILEAVARHSLAHPVHHGARVVLPSTEEGLSLHIDQSAG